MRVYLEWRRVVVRLIVEQRMGHGARCGPDRLKAESAYWIASVAVDKPALLVAVRCVLGL